MSITTSWTRKIHVHLECDCPKSASDWDDQQEKRRRPALLLAALLLAACGPSYDVGHRSASAVLLDGARNVEYARSDSQESIAYDLAPPPALNQAHERVDRALRTAGWTAVAAETPRPYVDARGGKREPVEFWRGTWRRDGEVAEYILEWHADRLHVWGRIGSSGPGSVAVFGIIEVRSDQIAVFCGPRGVAAVMVTAVSNDSADVAWRFRDPSGRDSAGRAAVRELPGDPRQTHVEAGDYLLTWAPATVKVANGKVVEAVSWLEYTDDVHTRIHPAAPIESLDLAALCR